MDLCMPESRIVMEKRVEVQNRIVIVQVCDARPNDVSRAGNSAKQNSKCLVRKSI